MKPLSVTTHFFAAAIITVVLLVVYASAQQGYRSAANDPQIQIARDLCNDISEGKPAILTGDSVDLTQSLSVFTELFDKNGKPQQSTGLLNGAFPQPPAGVFEFTNTNNEDILTWQPQANVRMAMVFEKVAAPGEGYVTAGRSLKETEVRESNLLEMIAFAWLVCMVILAVHLLIQHFILKRAQKLNNKKI
jgi:hypothetical protein